MANSTPLRLRILTLNVWGLPDFITKLVYKRYKNPKINKGRKWPSRRMRIASIADKLDAYDIICFQEVWIEEDQEFLKKKCAERGFPYSHVFSSGMLGSSGLQVISRYPIKEVYFHRYRVNGHVLRLDHGDYHAGKGFGYCKIAFGDQDIGIINTHTIAQYQTEDQYHPDRITQMWELIRFIQLASKPNQPMVILGDMNCRPESVEYQLLTKMGNLHDSLGEQIKKSKIKDDQGTTLMESSILSKIKSTASPRIDHIFYEKKKGMRLVNSKIVINEDDLIYSDHFGICSTFEFVGKDANSKESKRKLNLSVESSHHGSHDIEEEEEEDLDSSRKIGKNLLNECADIVKQGTKIGEQRKTSHLIRCTLSVLLLWLFISLNAPSPWVGAISVYMAVEFFIAMFVVENDLAALRETHKEIKYFHT